MSKKRTKYTSAFKTKLVLELLQNESTIVQIASKHNILPQNLQNWKKTFLANAEIAMEPLQQRHERIGCYIFVKPYYLLSGLCLYPKALQSLAEPKVQHQHVYWRHYECKHHK